MRGHGFSYACCMPLFAGFDPMEMTIPKSSIMIFYSKYHVYDALGIIWEPWGNESCSEGFDLPLGFRHQCRVRGDEFRVSVLTALDRRLCWQFLLVCSTKVTIGAIDTGNDGDQMLLVHSVEKIF